MQAKKHKVCLFLLAVLIIISSHVLEAQSNSDINSKAPIGWSYKKDLPAPRIQGGAVAYGSNIYYIGGRDSRRQKQNSVFRYDLRKNTWTTCAPMPTPRWNFSIAEYQGKIYAFGGDILISATEVFDPATNTWETLPPLPTQRVSAGCVVIGDLIYVIGGNERNLCHFI